MQCGVLSDSGRLTGEPVGPSDELWAYFDCPYCDSEHHIESGCERFREALEGWEQNPGN